MKKIRLRPILAICETKSNNEDFAITPYLAGVWITKNPKVIGLSLTWGWWSVFVGVGNNSKNYPVFINLLKEK